MLTTNRKIIEDSIKILGIRTQQQIQKIQSVNNKFNAIVASGVKPNLDQHNALNDGDFEIDLNDGMTITHKTDSVKDMFAIDNVNNTDTNVKIVADTDSLKIVAPVPFKASDFNVISGLNKGSETFTLNHDVSITDARIDDLNTLLSNQTYYVNSDAGLNTNTTADGSFFAPFATITECLAVITDHSTVYLSGEFTEEVVIDINKNIIFIGELGNCVINGTVKIKSGNVNIHNCTISPSNNSGDVNEVNLTGINTSSSGNVNIHNFLFDIEGDYGIKGIGVYEKSTKINNSIINITSNNSSVNCVSANDSTNINGCIFTGNSNNEDYTVECISCPTNSNYIMNNCICSNNTPFGSNIVVVDKSIINNCYIDGGTNGIYVHNDNLKPTISNTYCQAKNSVYCGNSTEQRSGIFKNNILISTDKLMVKSGAGTFNLSYLANTIISPDLATSDITTGKFVHNICDGVSSVPNITNEFISA